MSSLVRSLSTVALLATATTTVVAEDKEDAPGPHPERGGHAKFEKRHHPFPPTEMETVTFLGVESMPAGRVLATQLGLTPDTGLVVLRVMEGSPAAAALQEHDVLTRLDDQLLIDPRQLSVLVRAHKEGDVVKLTLIRGGKEQTHPVKLGRRELPKVAAGPMPLPPGAAPDVRFFHEGGGSGEWTQRLPGLDHEDIRKVMRMIGRDRHQWFGAPPVHFFSRDEDDGSTILNLAEGNFVFSDNEGTVEVQAADGKRELTVKNAKGEVTFQGPINNDAERAKLPREVVVRLEQIQKAELDTEPGEDFEQKTAIEPPAKTKIGLPPVPRAPRAPRFPASPPL